MDEIEQNLADQRDELEALSAIYPDCVIPTGERSVDLKIESSVTLHAAFPDSYPSRNPPKLTISAPILNGEEKTRLMNRLNETFEAQKGTCVLFSWIEIVKEHLEQFHIKNNATAATTTPSSTTTTPPKKSKAPLIAVKCPEILTGSCIEDRKSVFQGHFARVNSVDEVKAVMSKLLENRKIANATHNMMAYRIESPAKGSVIQDCDDDGETHAGSRMLHLLDIVEALNCVVVVSRWYGGVHLGPDRFKHINNATRDVLELGNAINKSSKKK